MDSDRLPRRFGGTSSSPAQGSLRSAFDVEDEDGPPRVRPQARRGRGRGTGFPTSRDPTLGGSTFGSLAASGSRLDGGFPGRSWAIDDESFGGSSSRSRSSTLIEDEAVRATDGDASLSRLSAVKQRYLVDPFAEALIRQLPSLPAQHQQSYIRPPLINLGTHARSWAIDTLVERFLTEVVGEDELGQVVSLGAGSDSRFWRFQADERLRSRLGSYVELDFTEITCEKVGLIGRSELLSAPLGGYTLASDGTRLDSATYHLLPIDLRAPRALTSALGSIPTLDPTRPTLWLAECLLVYLPPDAAAGVVRELADWSSKETWSGGAVYEMFGFDDPFGKRMFQNLTARNIPLPSARSYPTLESQIERFLKAGYTQACVRSIKEIQREDLPREEAERVRKLELLDEVEEMELLFEHYAVSWGWRPKAGVDSCRPWGLA